jgi:acid stress-induced BolA-like protein IbaG/YrbA
MGDGVFFSHSIYLHGVNGMNPDEIRSTLEKALPGATIAVQDLTGGGDHFQVVVVSSLFTGKTLLDQHQMVYGILRDALGSERIHALALKTYTPEQWERAASAR